MNKYYLVRKPFPFTIPLHMNPSTNNNNLGDFFIKSIRLLFIAPCKIIAITLLFA